MKLYEISNELLKLADMDAEEVDVEAELQNWQAEFGQKAKNIAGLVRNLTVDAEVLASEAQRLSAKSKAVHNRIDQIKDYLQSEMIRTGQDSIKAGIFKIRLQNSPRSLIIRNVEVIPPEFKEEIHEWKVDKLSILKHLKATGEIVDGVDVMQNKHVRIY